MDKQAVGRIAVLLGLLGGAAGLLAGVEAPANGPGRIELPPGRIAWDYDGAPLFRAEIESPPGLYRVKTFSEEIQGRVTQFLVFTARDWDDEILIRGEIAAGPESFPCQAEPLDRGLQVVRHVHGLSRNRLNRAVYDRGRDWLFSIDANPDVRIIPGGGDGGRVYSITLRGREIVLRFRPRYYQVHRGLKHFEPWTYRAWPKPVVGWCSWFAFYADITEQDVKRTADVFSEVLLPYGYEYFQIDDGYQRANGLPEYWLEPNDKFPSGLEALAAYIKARGLKPGIWTAVTFHQEKFAGSHPEYFVRDSDGRPAVGNWVQYSVDASNPGAMERIVRPVYRGLKSRGWEYFKVDGLRHLRYEGYNSSPDYFAEKGVDRAEVFRAYVRAVREEIGRDVFMLGCWGIRPELIGIIDGCRIGTDGYSFAGLSQFNSFNNVVWLNDPDHIELSPQEAYRSTMATSLTGSLFLLTDKPEVYRGPLVEPAKRAAPVLFTVPGQVYDVDPGRSALLDRADLEVSGSGPRVFDAGIEPHVHLFSLEIAKPFENWLLLGRTGGDFTFIPFGELGLESGREYLVFDFWSKRLLGGFTGGFNPGRIDPRFNCQLFCIRERLNRPQVVATDRHITCGGWELEDAAWTGKKLSGIIRLVGGEPTVLSVTEPAGYELESAECASGAAVEKIERGEGLLRVLLRSERSGPAAWRLVFRAPHP